MSRSYDVLVVGDYCLDLIFTGLPKMPELGVEVVSQGFAMVPGGPYNTVAALHRLGVRVGWAGDFGNDEFSRMILEQARKEGLDDALFGRHDRPLRKITVAASFPQDRAFLAYYDPDPSVPAALKALVTASARVLFIPGIYTGPALEAAKPLLKLKRMWIAMDGHCYDGTTLEDAAVCQSIGSARIFMPNALEARRLTGQTDLPLAMRRLGELCPLVVVKDGPNGAYAWTEGELVHVRALPVQPVDTTGAGDCFNAGFLAAYLQDLPLADCLRWGNVVGGLSTLDYGGSSRVVTAAEVRRRAAELEQA